MRTAILVGFACGASAYAPAAGVAGPRPAVRAASAPIFMMADDASVAEQSLEAEFASVKAASEVALQMAPTVQTLSKKKVNPVVGAWRRTKSLVGLRKEISQAAQELVGEECDLDQPEVCEEETRNMAKTIRQVLRVGLFGKATDEELASAETDGDSM